VQLEAVRAAELLGVTSPVLLEIEALQAQLTSLHSSLRIC